MSKPNKPYLTENNVKNAIDTCNHILQALQRGVAVQVNYDNVSTIRHMLWELLVLRDIDSDGELTDKG